MSKFTEDHENDNLTFGNLLSVKLEQVKVNDYPDFSDAFISFAEYKGKELTKYELDILNDEYSDIIHGYVIESLH